MPQAMTTCPRCHRDFPLDVYPDWDEAGCNRDPCPLVNDRTRCPKCGIVSRNFGNAPCKSEDCIMQSAHTQKGDSE